ncbi:MAG: YsnF/AvaK domain-containing protein [Chloroflexi bacterium]|nr:MAG: YsnF/AvaK domain-containing protein [Chloroflexota bacterium]
METTESPIVVGVFRERALAEQAVDELRHAGFRDDQIRYSGKGAMAGGLLETLMSKFSGQGDGSVFDALTEQGIPKDELEYYQHEYERGSAIVTVQSYGRQQEASDILSRFGAYDARSRTEYMQDAHTIQLREEVLQPRKHPVEIGEVFIRKVVVTEERTITVPVMREELVIERRSIATDSVDASDQLSNRPDLPDNQDQPIGKLVEIGEGEVIRIPIRTEQVMIEKRPVVIEELVVGKRHIQETRRFSGTVQREVPHIEREGNVNIRGDNVDVEDVPVRSEQ